MLAALAITSGCFGPLAAEIQAEPGRPITLSAASILPAELLKGKNYTIEDAVYNDGLINTYTLSTSYGPTTVESTGQLLMRIDELRAMTVMEEVDRKNVFGDALVRGVKAPVQTVVELVKDPAGTGKGIVEGTGRFFSNIGNAFTSEDPSQDNPVKVALGYDVAKRQFAYEFGIDPYTTYEPVVQALGKIARAATAGGLAPRAVLAAVDGGVATGLQISGTAKAMKELVRDKSPAELQKINGQKLLRMGVPSALTERFLQNYNYNPQEKTLLVGELAAMEGVKGRAAFIGRAVAAHEPSVAVYFRIMAQLMNGYHRKVTPVLEIINLDGTLHMLTARKAVVLPAPVDYLFWTDRLTRKITKLDQGIAGLGVKGGKEVWVTGRIDGEAQEVMSGGGWKIVENCGEKLLH